MKDKKLTIRLSSDQLVELAKRANELKLAVSELVRTLILRYLKKV